MTNTSASTRDGRVPDTRTRILDTALILFTQHGFVGTSLQQIADSVGLTKAALYYHFPSKDDLLGALVKPAVDDIERLLDAYADSERTPTLRRRFIADYLDYLLGHRRLLAFVVRDLATLAHPALSNGRQERQARVNALLASDQHDFKEQIRVALAFQGFGSVIAQYPDADSARLRQALLDAGQALLRPTRKRNRR